MANFDLNLNNYSKNELEGMFSLSPNYNPDDVSSNHSQLTSNIISNSNIDSATKTKTIEFLTNAKKSLLEGIANMRTTEPAYASVSAPTNQPTTIAEVNNSDLILSVATIKDTVPKPPNPEYMQTHPSNYFIKTVNPVIQRNRTINLNIDSRFRENYYVSEPSNFHVTLPVKLHSVVNVALATIEFPNTAFYIIAKSLGNYFFWLRAGSEAAGDLEQTVVTLPDGNYIATDALSLINTYLQSLTSTTYLQYIFFAINENATNTSGSSQMVVAVNSSYPYTTPFNFIIDLQSDINGNPDFYTPLPLKLGWLCGFRNGIYTNNSSYLSEGILALAGARYLWLVIDDYNNANNVFYGAFTDSLLNKNILARISVQSSRSDAITQSNIATITPTREYYGPVDIEKMQVQLLDEYGRIVNLNNMDYSFCLTYTTGTDNYGTVV